MSGLEFADPKSIERNLRALGNGAGEPVDLAEAALVLAALDRPRVDLGRYRRHLAGLAAEARMAVDGTGNDEDVPLDRRIAAINRTLFDEHGYAGDRDTYDDLQNANLMQVIDRRRGLPIALAILHLHMSGAAGLEAAGVNFPGHFLVRCSGAGETSLIDPFNAGRAVDAAELRRLLKAVEGDDAEIQPHHYAPADDRAILLRLQNNIKLRLIKAQDYAAALPVAERMLWLSPENASLWHEIGVLNAQLGHYGAAIDALQTAARHDATGALQHEVAALMQQLRRRLN